MRLTKSDKEAFIRAVMDDVPRIDYDEKVRSLLKQWGLASLPEDLRPLAVKYPEYFAQHWINTPYGVCSAYAISNLNWASGGFKENEPEKYAQLVEIGALAIEQNKARAALENQVSGIISTCSTLKTAEERLPEFKKYLPADRGGSGLANLPVANVLAELMNAGWPKGQGAAA